MFAWPIVAIALSGSSPAEARTLRPAQEAEPKLKGLTAAEAESLIAKLRQAQADLKAGRSETFELLSGAPASYRAAQVAPISAFTKMQFNHPWSIEREPAQGVWQSYELRYFPPGRHALMWKVTATFGLVGQLVRVEMLYTAPPPF